MYFAKYRNNIKRIITFFFILITLVNCGGGGSGSSSSSSSSSSTGYVTAEYNNQYGLGNINASAAYDRGYNGDGTKVAVLDGGFDTSHTDLDANFITGYDTEDSDNTPNADSHNTTLGGHGTHVAGIIAAEKNDSGMHGVAYNASIIPIKIFKDDASMVSGINLGIDYATDNGAIALNNSWGTYRDVSATCSGVSCYVRVPYESSTGYFTSAERTSWAGVATDNNVVVFAAGNHGMNSVNGRVSAYRSSDDAYLGYYTPQVVVNALSAVSYVNRSSPEARYGTNASAVEDNWLNVIAVDASNNTIATFSNGCGDTKAYCIAAPGTDIYSTVPTDLNSDGFDTMDGTSMAAPHVAAAVAVLKHEYPNLTGAEIVDLLLDNATDLGDTGTDEVYGVGLLNLDAATKPSGAVVMAQTDQDNNLDKFDLSSTTISFSSLFNDQIISKQNFIGVVDDYNRVYSHNMKDYANFHEGEKSLLNEMILGTKNQIIEKIKIDKFNTSNFITTDNSSLIKYENVKFQNHINPYNKILTQSNGIQTFYNSKIKSNFTILDNEISNNNFNFIYSSNLINKNNTKLKLGMMNEGNTFLGTKGTGLFENKENTKTYFIDYENNFKIKPGNLLLDFTLGQTHVDFKQSKYIDNSKITTSAYTLGLQSSFNEIKVKNFIGFNHPLSIINGTLDIKTISGYDSEGDYVNRDQSINLSNSRVNFIISTTKFFSEKSLIKLNTKINDDNSSIAGLYVFTF